MKLIFFLILFFFFVKISHSSEECKWNTKKTNACVTIIKTPNTSEYSKNGVNKIIISKEYINNISAIDMNDVLKNVQGIDIFQSGGKGQNISVFTRGSESNHTLAMMNGISINDQSVTDGLHDFGQDFINSIQQIDVYKGSNGAHFGPGSIAGAINFITGIDYVNSVSLSGYGKKNSSSKINFTKITDNNLHLNLKGGINLSETGSAIAGGSEYDGSENFQLNLNTEKWLNDSLKFKSTIYSRKTVSDFDGSEADELGYVSDNRMNAVQASLEKKFKQAENNITLHYHHYDRQYENSGFLDEYYSESFVIKNENKNIISKKFSYGYGSEYKYDQGYFENRGDYSASTKGHVKNLGIFGNIGYKLNEKSSISTYVRTDDHKTTGGNQTYKINFTQSFNKLKFNLSHSTGLRNPTLYELYGSDNYGIKGNDGLIPEKSKTNEFLVEFNISENLGFNSTAYRSKIYDQIEANSSYSKHENEILPLNQEGIENEFFLQRKNDNFSIYNTFSKSKNKNNQAQLRRPDLTYGINYFRKFIESPIGSFNLNLNYKYTGEYIDLDGSANSNQKSTNILDLYLNKRVLDSLLSLKITNLLNERYEKPASYMQEGRQFRVAFKKFY